MGVTAVLILLMKLNPEKVLVVGNFFAVGQGDSHVLSKISVGLLGFFFAILVHEVGHGIMGHLRGMRFDFLSVGPLKLAHYPRGWRLCFHKPRLMLGGLTYCSPRKSNFNRLDMACYLFAGPAANFLLSFTIVAILHWGRAELAGTLFWSAMVQTLILSTLLGLSSLLLPSGLDDLRSDGQQILHLIRNTPRSRATMAQLKIFGHYNIGTLESEFPEDLLHELAKTTRPNERIFSELVFADVAFAKGQQEEALRITTDLLKEWDETSERLRPVIAGAYATFTAIVSKDATEARIWSAFYSGDLIDDHRREILEALIFLADNHPHKANEAFQKSVQARAHANHHILPNNYLFFDWVEKSIAVMLSEHRRAQELCPPLPS